MKNVHESSISGIDMSKSATGVKKSVQVTDELQRGGLDGKRLEKTNHSNGRWSNGLSVRNDRWNVTVDDCVHSIMKDIAQRPDKIIDVYKIDKGQTLESILDHHRKNGTARISADLVAIGAIEKVTVEDLCELYPEQDVKDAYNKAMDSMPSDMYDAHGHEFDNLGAYMHDTYTRYDITHNSELYNEYDVNEYFNTQNMYDNLELSSTVVPLDGSKIQKDDVQRLRDNVVEWGKLVRSGVNNKVRPSATMDSSSEDRLMMISFNMASQIRDVEQYMGKNLDISESDRITQISSDFGDPAKVQQHLSMLDKSVQAEPISMAKREAMIVSKNEASVDSDNRKHNTYSVSGPGTGRKVTMHVPVENQLNSKFSTKGKTPDVKTDGNSFSKDYKNMMARMNMMSDSQSQSKDGDDFEK